MLEIEPTAPDFVFPILCFTKDGDIWGLRTEAELATCGPETLRDGVQLDMTLVDATGRTWSVTSVKQLGNAPAALRDFIPFATKRLRVEHKFRSGPTLSLPEVLERACAALDAFPQYWCDALEDLEQELVERKAEVLIVSSIAGIHEVLGLDYFGA